MVFFLKDGDCEEGGSEERERGKRQETREGREKSKEERTEKEKNFFFSFFRALLVFLFNFCRLSL